MSDLVEARHERDRELVSQARAGSADAFTDLVDIHHPTLLRYLTRLTGDHELAADLAQETFLMAFRRLHQLVEDRSFAAWLYQIGRNQWFTELRRRKRYQFLSLDRLLTHAARVFGHLDEPDIAITHGERDDIQQALNQLSPTLREALLLHRMWGFTGHEIAQVLEISASAARKRVARANDEFRTRYTELTGEHQL